MLAFRVLGFQSQIKLIRVEAGGGLVALSFTNCHIRVDQPALRCGASYP